MRGSKAKLLKKFTAHTDPETKEKMYDAAKKHYQQFNHKQKQQLNKEIKTYERHRNYPYSR